MKKDTQYNLFDTDAIKQRLEPQKDVEFDISENVEKEPVAVKKVSLYAEEERIQDDNEYVEIDEDSLYYDEELDNVERKKEIIYGRKEKVVKPQKTIIKPKTIFERVVLYSKLAALVLIPVVIISIISIVILKNTNYGQYKLGYITKGTIAEIGSGESYIIRKTDVIESPKDGVFVAALSEGTHVDAGNIIGYITTEENKNVLLKLGQVTASISTLLKLDVENSNSQQKSDMEDLEKLIGESRLSLVAMSRGGSLSDIPNVKDDIDQLLVEKNELILKRETEDETINTLKRQKNELLLIVETEMTPVFATRSGILSYNFSKGDEIENEYFSGLAGGNGIKSLNEVSSLSNKSFYDCLGDSVEEGQKVARLIVEQDYYIIIKLEEGELVKNQTITLSSKDMTFNTTGYVLTTSIDDGFAIVSASRGIDGCLSTRKVAVTYDLEKSSGYCFPESALLKLDNENGTAKVAVIKQNRVRFISVSVDIIENGKAIVFQGIDEDGYSFKTGDCFVVNPQKIRNGQRIEA